MFSTPLLRVLTITAAMAALGACHRHRGHVLASAHVGSEGGRIVAPGVTLDIPAGALPDGQTISISAVDPEELDGIDALAPGFELEPAGLVFDKPVQVTLSLPDNMSGAVRWSTLDGSGFEFVGFAEGGVAVGVNNHFSTTVATAATCSDAKDAKSCQGCGAPETGEAVCTPTETEDGPGKPERCRRLCGCRVAPPDSGLLCATKPPDWTSQCPSNPQVPRTDGTTMLGERDGDACGGFRRVARPQTLCECVAVTANPGNPREALCPVPWAIDQTGSLGCHTTPEWGGVGAEFNEPEAQAPPADDEAHPEYTDPRYSDYGIKSYVEGPRSGLYDCLGYWKDVTGPTPKNGEVRLGGSFDNCNASPTDLDLHWEDRGGTSENCSTFEWPEGFAVPPMSSDDRFRCRLTKEEWDTLKQRRSDCKVSPLPLNTLSILRVASEPSDGGSLQEMTGISSKAREGRPDDGVCPGAVKDVPKYKGIGAFTGIDDDGNYINSEVTSGHAEGDALLQLAKQRGRQPKAGDGTAGSDWGAEGGREGGCGEMITDRDPCGYACAKEGINAGRSTSGLGLLIGRSPRGCTCYGEGLPAGGSDCLTEKPACAGWDGNIGSLCKPR